MAKDQRRKFKDRFKLGVGLGYTRAKTDIALSLSLGLNTRYKTRRSDTGLDYKDYAASVGPSIVARTNLDYGLSYIIPNEWVFNGKSSLFASSEQSLDIRRNFTLGFGRNLLYREEKLLAWAGAWHPTGRNTPTIRPISKAWKRCLLPVSTGHLRTDSSLLPTGDCFQV